MISLHNVSGAGHALQYFAADNYYTQDEGLEHSAWFGKGAAALGLTGQVDKDEFFKTLNGCRKMLSSNLKDTPKMADESFWDPNPRT